MLNKKQLTTSVWVPFNYIVLASFKKILIKKKSYKVYSDELKSVKSDKAYLNGALLNCSLPLHPTGCQAAVS